MPGGYNTGGQSRSAAAAENRRRERQSREMDRQLQRFSVSRVEVKGLVVWECWPVLWGGMVKMGSVRAGCNG